MKTKHSVTLFFMVGLVFAITGLVSPTMAQDERSYVGTADTGSDTEGVAAAGEIEEDIAPNAPLPTRYLRVTGSVFKPWDSSVGWAIGAQGGSIYATSGSSSVVWNSPLYLPQGTRIQKVRMYYYDNSAANNCSGWFTIYDLYGDVVDEWWVSSSGTPGDDFDDTDAINHTIDYGSYSYVLNWRPNHLGSAMRLNGFRVFYYPSGTRYGSSLILSNTPP